MAALSTGLSTSSGDLTQSADEDGFLDAPLLPSQKLQSVIRPHFHPVPTICISILLALVNLAYVTLAVVAIYFCLFSEKEKKCKQSIDPFQLSTVLVISKLVLWLLHVVNERFAQHHHCKARSRGFLHLYRSTRHLKALPLIIHSTGNAALLLILSVQDSFTSNSQLYPCLILSVLLLELILSVICLIIYTGEKYHHYAATKWDLLRYLCVAVSNRPERGYIGATHVKPFFSDLYIVETIF
ncbi:hypothetical protein XENTR_v10000660 [Xenopus tropicalis]|nr:hypothetical protein XENTR_v10000660 [Xenopus tropicalis]